MSIDSRSYSKEMTGIFIAIDSLFVCRGLECSRTRVHRQLVVALILNALSLLAISAPVTLHNLRPDIPNITKETVGTGEISYCEKIFNII